LHKIAQNRLRKFFFAKDKKLYSLAFTADALFFFFGGSKVVFFFFSFIGLNFVCRLAAASKFLFPKARVSWNEGFNQNCVLIDQLIRSGKN